MSTPLPNRRSIRLQEYDYSQQGLYFVTICCQDKICRFGQIIDREMLLNDAGRMAEKCWKDIPLRFPQAILHEFVIMPNHIHAIIEISDVGATLAVAQEAVDCNLRATARIAPTLGAMVGAYKSITLNQCLRLYVNESMTMGRLWQRNYYEHIIRNYRSYQNITDYIYENPSKWADDDYYTE